MKNTIPYTSYLGDAKRLTQKEMRLSSSSLGTLQSLQPLRILAWRLVVLVAPSP